MRSLHQHPRTPSFLGHCPDFHRARGRDMRFDPAAKPSHRRGFPCHRCESDPADRRLEREPIDADRVKRVPKRVPNSANL